MAGVGPAAACWPEVLLLMPGILGRRRSRRQRALPAPPPAT
ncbi:MAG: hypothetical protein AVDCRST_MAG65-1666 [uncultured Solirubrobacteraceae bacterium]|uniref:Uncharacterized protein n=1 Tax=uncultured Solirubrobacteraceae bacterium TaxID=1162706 RepID=A0A6J4RYB2_9ACTN|nr:MAG: hypothetical protein AVDCRST_MAG65-1666 [uncultured Solirubrobacteraceae bacterium]